MVRITTMLALAASAIPFATATTFGSIGLMDLLSDLPSCGLDCFIESQPNSTCAGIDADCYCSDQQFLDVAATCVLRDCSTLDALDIQKVIAKGCHQPIRNRKKDLLLQLIIEIPAGFAPWLRLFASFKFQERLSLDDYLMAFAGLCYTVFLTLGAYLGQSAFGVDMWWVEPAKVVEGLKFFYIGETMYLTTLCITKIAVITFMMRIFTTRHFRWLSIAAIAFITIPSVAILFLQIFQCHPVHLIWDGWLTNEWQDNCLDITVLTAVAAGFNIAQDALIIVMPMPWLIKLKVDMRTKIGIILMFSLGVFVLATSCARLHFVLAFGHTQNPTWDYVDPIIWSGIEGAVSLIIACLPGMRLLLIHYIPWLGSLSSRGNSKSDRSKQASGYGKIEVIASKVSNIVSSISQTQKGSKDLSRIDSDSQTDLRKNPFMDRSYEENGYRCKTPTEVKVASAENSYELQNTAYQSYPQHGILVQNELIVRDETLTGPVNNENRRFLSS